jgi:transcriptional regulator with XRE-family HTH domain
MTGEDLRRRRDALGLSQAKLGEALGVSGNTVARWERDEMSIPPYLSLALQTLEREKLATKPKAK